MSQRDKFYEMLSSLSSTAINDLLFKVSKPIAVDGTKTVVTLEPYGESHLYGSRSVSYTRFDLSTVVGVELVTNNEQYTHELVQRLARFNLFKYRIYNPAQPSVTKTRFLTLTANDIVTAVVPRIFSQPVKMRIKAAEDSDFFVGELEITIRPAI